MPVYKTGAVGFFAKWLRPSLYCKASTIDGTKFLGTPLVVTKWRSPVNPSRVALRHTCDARLGLSGRPLMAAD